MNVWNVTALFPVVMLAAAPAMTEEWFSASRLEASCDAFLADPVDTEAALCVAYLQGFIAGGDAAPSSPHAGTRETDPADGESLSERAIRTRLGSLRLMRVRALGNTSYCLDESVSALDVVETVATHLKDHEEATSITDPDAVHTALVHEFPCEA